MLVNDELNLVIKVDSEDVRREKRILLSLKPNLVTVTHGVSTLSISLALAIDVKEHVVQLHCSHASKKGSFKVTSIKWILSLTISSR